MTQEELVNRAKAFAVGLHARIGQQRKYTQKPYAVHLQEVAAIVSSVSDDPEMLAAAWLHDSVEDTPVTHEEIERNFGSGVARLVHELTDVSRPSDGNRKVRKAIDLRHTASISPRAKTIKLADLIDNSLDISQHDPRFAKVYLEEMRALLEVLNEGDPALLQRARQTLAECSRKLTPSPPPNAHPQPETEPDAAIFFQQQHGIRLFTEAFTARDILEPLLSFDREGILAGLPAGLDPAQDSVAGIRVAGRLAGYLGSNSPAPSTLPDLKPFAPQQVVDLDAPLVDVIHVLTHFSCCFVTVNGEVIGVIRRRDIEKPVVRMWLFGMVILIEMMVLAWIRSNWPDDGWTGMVSEGRLAKAKELLEERRRRGVSGDLLDCLQFADKLQMVAKDPGLAKRSGFASIAAAKKTFKQLELLRNNLAHGQAISGSDWPSIVGLTRRVYDLLRRTH